MDKNKDCVMFRSELKNAITVRKKNYINKENSMKCSFVIWRKYIASV